jgi:hypothetical protein
MNICRDRKTAIKRVLVENFTFAPIAHFPVLYETTRGFTILFTRDNH